MTPLMVAAKMSGVVADATAVKPPCPSDSYTKWSTVLNQAAALRVVPSTNVVVVILVLLAYSFNRSHLQVVKTLSPLHTL